MLVRGQVDAHVGNRRKSCNILCAVMAHHIRAVASPIPPAPPITMATFPVRSNAPVTFVYGIPLNIRSSSFVVSLILKTIIPCPGKENKGEDYHSLCSWKLLTKFGNIFLSDPFFRITAVSADISVYFDCTENSKTSWNVVSGTVGSGITFDIKNIYISTFGTAPCVFHR